MAEISPELGAAIEVAKQRIEVEPYYPLAMSKGVKGHARGVWAGTLLGLASGAFCGAIVFAACFFAGITGGAVGLLPLVLGFAGLGGVTGTTIGSRIGASAGVVGGVLEEKERREKGEKLEQEILSSPEKQAEAIEAYRANPVVEKADTVGEAFATMPRKKAWSELWDAKSMLFDAGLGALVGIVMFAGVFAATGGLGIPGYLAMAGMTGWGAAAFGAAAGAGVGATFGVTYPMIFASLSKGAGHILSYDMARGIKSYPPIKTAAEMQQEAVQNRAVSTYAVAPLRMDVPTTRVGSVMSVERLIDMQQKQTSL